MTVKKFHIYLADLNPRYGTEPGKFLPIVIIQTNLLNAVHPSTIICPITSQVFTDATILRVHLSGKITGLNQPSDILVDQIRAIDNRRIQQELGQLTLLQQKQLMNNLSILLLE